MTKLITPDYYTDREGGEWLPWTGLPVSTAELHTILVNQGSRIRVTADKKAIHSLLFGSYLYNYTPRWDCYNGWTHKPNKQWWDLQARVPDES